MFVKITIGLMTLTIIGTTVFISHKSENTELKQQIEQQQRLTDELKRENDELTDKINTLNQDLEDQKRFTLEQKPVLENTQEIHQQNTTNTECIEKITGSIKGKESIIKSMKGKIDEKDIEKLEKEKENLEIELEKC